MHSIDRRAFIGVSAATAAALLASPLRVLAQANPSNFHELRRGVGYFMGQGGTIGWYVSTKGAVVIDSQFPRTAEICLGRVKELFGRGNDDRRIDFLINTHHHGDHTGGNPVFKTVTDKIVAHQNVPELQKKQATERGNLEGQVYADTLFETEWKHDFGHEVVHAKHYGPAHTGGDAVIRFEKANVAHMGDLVFHYWHPFIDLPGGGTITGWVDVLQKAHDDLDDETMVIFGHGALSKGVTGTRKGILTMRDYFRRAIDTVRPEFEKGTPIDEVAAMTPKGSEEYESASERMSLSVILRRTYEDLAKQKEKAAEEKKKDAPTSRPRD